MFVNQLLVGPQSGNPFVFPLSENEAKPNPDSWWCSSVRKKEKIVTLNLGCQMVHFRTENPNLGTIWRVLKWNILVYCKAIYHILWPFGIFYGLLVHFMVFWYILWSFDKFYGRLVHFTCGRLVYFMVIWYIFYRLVCCSKKNLATLPWIAVGGFDVRRSLPAFNESTNHPS
jgi:hypothetical protein